VKHYSWDLLIDGVGEFPDPPSVTVRGEGTDDPYRIFEIAAGATVTIKDLKIANGLASEGGGIRNLGTLALHNSFVENNFAAQLNNEFEVLGAGISNRGTLTITDASSVQGNRIKTIQDCMVVSPGGEPDSPLPSCPWQFFGAGIFNEDSADLEISGGSLVEGNLICHDPNDDDNDFCKANQFPNNAAQFSGGGIHNRNGTVDVVESTIRNNVVEADDPGVALAFRGWGGGIHAECRGVPNCLTVEYSTISGNVAHVHGTLEGTPGLERDTPQAEAEGGALSIFGDEKIGPGSASIINSTITGNRVDTDLTGSACFDGLPPGRSRCSIAGGAIWFKGMYLDIRWTTIEGNSIIFNDGAPKGAGIQGSRADGWTTVLILRSNIFAYNELIKDGPVKDNIDLEGLDMNSLGHNLFDDNPDDGVGVHPTDQIDTPQCFYDLGIHGGGLTETLPPERCEGAGTTWAFNAGGSVEVTDDQRKQTRPKHGAPDVGAYECDTVQCSSEPDDGSGIMLPPGFGADAPAVSHEQAARAADASVAHPPAVTLTKPAMPVFRDAVRGRLLPITTAPVLPWHDPLQPTVDISQ
jgi:hypothetical protein